MVRLSKNELDSILSKCEKRVYSSLIETGSFYGQTIEILHPYFDSIHTIEIQPELHTYCSNKFRDIPKIKCHFGDSSKFLPNLLSIVNTDTVFWLDGHWSCENTGKGDKEVPLLEELQSINKLFKHHAVIIIDDYRLFNGKDAYVNWSEITEKSVLSQIETSRLVQYFVEGDRFVIEIN
jgi:hypothetical protein